MLDSSARRPCSGSSRAARRGLRRVQTAGVIAVVLGLLVTGCAQEKKAAPPASPTPIATLNTAAMQVPRIKFCALVPKAAVSDALGGKPDSDTSYGNGEEEDLAGVGQDVVHEIGCAWNTDEGVSARAWVFARPVAAGFARTVIASGRRTTGCRTVRGPAYGEPSETQVCRLPDGEHRVRHSGLFGDTWLTCELSADQVVGTELRTRADRWCVEIANALNTAR
jgi:hypothetical protein